ncbi:hypothetical protein [Dehalobacter sp. TeCB1]|uniref:hypothetical protein n=1 Tax=Dehalobacter sp. TeCB1 TaxID=1843715 RepID=UPI000839F01D|nr:hypothetical protein [Dehalobacter sp. TeCB1]OCZ51359.1 hypothetical protein A7D23_13135 [Dehalobacter sp. TeCB1]
MVKLEIDISDNLNQRLEGFSVSIGMDKYDYIRFAVLMQLEKMEIIRDENRLKDPENKNMLSTTYIEVGDKNIPLNTPAREHNG